jgi:hypothetical protein
MKTHFAVPNIIIVKCFIYDIPFSSDETASEAVKEPSDLLVPPGGCSSAPQDVESSPVSTSTNDNTPLLSSESAPTTPQASPSSVPADSGESHARRMGKLWTYMCIPFQQIFYMLMLHVFVIIC